MLAPPPRFIHLVHDLPGRLRLRLWWLRDAPGEATPLAERLAELDGLIEVQCRPFTGSVLCRYDPARLDRGRILAVVREATAVDRVVNPGEADPQEDAALLRSAVEGNDIALSAAALFRGLNLDVLKFTEGRIDLGTLVALAFATAGAAEVAVARKLVAPPWFNLAWWAFRTFATMEQHAIQRPRPG